MKKDKFVLFLERIITSKILLKEKEGEETYSDIANEYIKLFSKGYEEFVPEFKEFIKDDKVLKFLRNGLKDGVIADDKMNVSKVSIPVSKLIPTQNEIDVSKSLNYPLTSIDSARLCLGGNNVIIANTPILIFNNRYIIDGHHRWSQLYVLNPDATMVAINITKKIRPLDMLKNIQVVIGTATGEIPTANAKGINLLKSDLGSLKNYISKNISVYVSGLIAKVKGFVTKGEVINYLIDNIKQMQDTNQPISGAPERGLMPQTDSIDNVERLLLGGEVNFAPPFTISQENRLAFQESTYNKRRKIILKSLSKKR